MKYIDKTGLSHLWDKIKDEPDDKQDTLIAATNITITYNVVSEQEGVVKMLILQQQTLVWIWINALITIII